MKQLKTTTLIRDYWFIFPTLLGIITLAAYYPSLHYSFQFDDIANITKHFNIRYHTWSSLFFKSSRWLSFWLNAIHYSIGKFDPFSYRVGNVLIHLSNGMLVFAILFFALSRLRQKNFFQEHSFAISLLTATLFWLHPVQTQTVSYVIQGELEGMAALFSLGTIFCFLLRSYNTGTTKIIATLALFTLTLFACGTKEITIMLPALLLLVDWFFVAQGSWQDLKSRWWLHSIVTFSMLSMYIYLLKPKFFADLFGFKMLAKNNIGNVITKDPDARITPYAYFISQFKVILHYLWIFIWPYGISVEYDWVLSDGFFAPDAVIPFATLLMLACGIWYLLHHNKINPLAFGALWFALCAAPRSSIIPSPELLVDYKTYLPSIGWLFIIATALIYACQFIINKFFAQTAWLVPAHAQLAFIFLLSIPLGHATQQRNTVWRSGKEFWWNIIQNAPGKARAYNNYGVELSQTDGDFEGAIPYFKKAIAMDKKYPDPCNNLAVAYARTDNINGAIEAITQGLTINPYYPEGYNNLASFFLTKKDYANAKRALETALRLRPYYGKAFYNLGRVYLAEDNKEEAWKYFKKCCLEGDLDTADGFKVYAQTSLSLKKYGDAIVGYTKLLELQPNDPGSWFNLGNAYFLKEEYTKALSIYQQLLVHHPGDQMLLYNIGETYAHMDQLHKAIEYFEQAPQMIARNAARLAECYSKVGNETKAKELLAQTSQQALQAHPA